MKPDIEYRPRPFKIGTKVVIQNKTASPVTITAADAMTILTHRRALKAAQMRRYRAKKRGRK